ncbi:VRR-NUC domain-containing protein [Morganella morganii]|uniref:VRR-NUC domain-containing protein n=3 Tax=Morganella morganii TaxID=582 RepID=UPI001BD9449A|nr:VRR-NUC domain-containing protein [Morganella morganii]EKT0592096.1 VRR-NUC domain-containing protein [Morganella morganii]MBT0519882.1 VRR-NUC domain-containing protein [Morganella morganii subsp. morganii]QWL88880.1 VRR-NUC domain-containing protein [Morganella morganii subsp. morganii]HEI8572297.1 VRR-NUC domain-containing protein [Morganella morganii]
MKPMKEVCPGSTTITCRVEGAQLPSLENECYLKEKALFAIYFPRKAYTKDGAKRSLKQLAMSGLIRIEEIIHDWLWSYKAEVVFAIRGAKKKPLPMMATSDTKRKKYEGNLPHSENPFARPSPEQWLREGVTQMRRPDIILVRDQSNRWPGRNEGWDGKRVTDNLLRLIEVKFPGDRLSEEQARDYQLIATEERFSVFHVEDNRRRKERESARQAQAGLLATYEKRHGTLPVSEESLQTLMLVDIPLVSEQLWQYKPVLSLWWALNVDIPAFGQIVLSGQPEIKSPWQQFTEGLDIVGEYIATGYYYTRDAVTYTWEITCDYAQAGLNYLNDELQAAFSACGAWFRDAGKWVVEEIVDPVTNKVTVAIQWVSEKTKEIIAITKEAIIEAWQKIQQYTELTIEMLKSVDWYQVMTDLKNGLVQFVMIVGGVIVTVIAAVVVIAAIIFLIEVLAAAIAAGAAAVGAVMGILAAAVAVNSAIQA